MSTLVVPSFIVSLFSKEILHIHEELLLDISKRYNISYEDLEKRYLSKVDIISNNLEKINIAKKREYNKNLPKTKQCIALTKNNSQCLRSKGTHDQFCIIHMNNQPYGILDNNNKSDNFEKDISTKNTNRIQRPKKIY